MIQQRNQLMRQKKLNKRRALKMKMITHLNTGILVLSASSVLNLVSKTTEPLQVNAQTVAKKFSPQEFINAIGSAAKQIATNNNLYASVMIAQAALESGWGNSALAQSPNYNLFGIKGSYNGQTVSMNTLEDPGNGKYYAIDQNFKRYNSYDQSLQDYANTLTGVGSEWRRKHYEGALVSNTNSYQDATAHLTGRYATDTTYASKLNQLIESYQLTRFDAGGAGVAPVVRETSQDSRAENAPTYASSTTGDYRVKAGDSLYRIAQNHGVTLSALCQANGLTSSSMIHPNQYLNIPGASTRTQTNQATEEASYTAPVANTSAPSREIPTVSRTSSGGYTIKAGDSLYAIAKKHGVTLSALCQANGLSLSSTIHPNQVLSIPGSSTGEASVETPVYAESKSEVSVSYKPVMASAPRTEAATRQTVPVSSGSTYTVQAGDGLWRIATNHGMTIEQLKAANGLTSNFIYPGQVLNLVGGYSSASSVEVETPAHVTETATEATTSSNTTSKVIDYTSEDQAQGTAEVEAPASNGTHVIQAGDTLYKLSRIYGVDVYDLIEKNGGPNVYIGQVIYL